MQFCCGFVSEHPVSKQHCRVFRMNEKLSISQHVKQVFVSTVEYFLTFFCFTAAISACHGSHVLRGPGRT